MSDDSSFRFNTGPEHITGPDTHLTYLTEAISDPQQERGGGSAR
jgi:hypothetical protein